MKQVKIVIVAAVVLVNTAAVVWAASDERTPALGVAFQGKAAVVGNQEQHSATEEHEHSEEGHTEEPTHDEGSEVELTPEQIELAGVRSTAVARGEVYSELALTGEVTLNQDKVVHMTPRVPGTIAYVVTDLGDRVFTGELLLVLESRDLADAKAEYLAAKGRLSLAQTRFNREARLWKQKISSEQDFLDAKQALNESEIETQSSEHKLRALGLTTDDLAVVHDDESFANYHVIAPFDGTVIEKHVVKGERVDEGSTLFRLASLDTVWVIGSVYEKDIGRVKRGQPASVTVKAYPDRVFRGTVKWVADIIDEKTRTLKIRVEVDNSSRLLKPGMFASIAVAVEAKDDVITVPPSALQRQKDETIVFVDRGNGEFERREVRVGLRSSGEVEIIEGLAAGEKVVSDGSFILKSELEKEGFGGGHAH